MCSRSISYIFTVLYVWTVFALASASPGYVVAPKNVVFGVLFGGSSHVNWVLAIMDELATRGHTVTVATRDDYFRFSKPFEQLKTVKITDHHIVEHEVLMDWAYKRNSETYAIAMDARASMYAEEFRGFKALFLELNPDAIVCDLRTEACIDAARLLRLPFIITSSLASSPDSGAPYIEQAIETLTEPTSLTMSFPVRFYNKFIVPYRTKADFRDAVRRFEEVRKQVGAPPASPDSAKDSLKLYNTAFGFEPARPMGPLVEMVGPIIHQKYATLGPQLKEYLDSHRQIVFIAFGQNFAPTKEGVETILGALLDIVDKGIIDGFLWATVHANIHNVSSSITLPSGEHRDISDILAGENPHCRLAEWVPQQAILQHPSVSVYLMHGGKGSLYESLLNGVRVVIYPMMGDQPFNARTVVNTKLGGTFDRHASSKQASEVIEMVVRDIDGDIQKNVDRYQQLVRIRSEHGASKGADLVEEVAYMHQGGLLPHRYEASRQMSFFKSTNLDLYATLILAIVVTAFGSWRLLRKALEFRLEPKRKVL